MEQPESNLESRPFFIVGCGRSGTSMLRDMLRSHPRLFLDQESHFLPWAYRAYGDPTSNQQAEQLGSAILQMLARREFDTDLSPEDFRSCRSYRDAASLPFRRAAKAAGKPRWGDKTPHYVEHIDLIREIFPEAIFVHIVRDGRDVARSMLRSHFGPNTMVSAARTWRRRVSSGREARRRLGDQVVHELRYEDLLAAPERCLRAVLDFLDEPFEPSVLRPSLLAHPAPRTMLGRRRAPKIRQAKVDPSRAYRWRETLTLQQRTLFESVAADLLAECGYELEGLGRPIPRWRQTSWQAVEWPLRLLARIRTLDVGSGWLRLLALRLRARLNRPW